MLPVFIEPEWISSPTLTFTGKDSPVKFEVSIKDCPSLTIPSRATFSPGFTIIISPGFMNLSGNHLLGGVEFVPSNLVPYDIPRSEETAFITCIYLSNEDYDYKSAPLIALEDYLKNKYKKVLVISDEIGVFPNGNLDFFLKNNYKDQAIVFEDDYCKLHLMSKIL